MTDTQDEEDASTRLRFDIKQLKQKTSTLELAKRIQALHEELSLLEQETVDRASIEAICKDLIATNLLHHKDKSVKAYLACCLADVLQLLAPDAPYTQLELSDIFQFIFRQIKTTSRPSDSHHAQHAYLLDSISKAKSACLVFELPNPDDHVRETFKDFFDAIGQDTPAICAQCMADILSQLIDESQTVALSIVEMLLAQFHTKTIKLKPSSHQLAVRVCTLSSDRLQRYVSQYFTDVFTSAHDQKIEGDIEEAYDELAKAHDLIIQLNKNVPAILLNVIPAIEEALRTDDAQIRELAARTLGKMTADRAGMVDHLAKKHNNTWKAWLGRSKDKSPAVRVAVVEHLGAIWAAHSELASEVQGTLQARLEDPDDKVRAAACRTFKTVEFDAVLHQVQRPLLKALADRVRDRKPTVSAEALHGLCRMYSLAYTDISSNDAKATESFGWIPEHILLCWPTPDMHVQTSIESAVLSNILPLPARAEEIDAWVDRFLTVYRSLSSRARQIVQRIAHLSDKRPTIYERYLQACEEYNGGTVDGDEEVAKNKMLSTCQYLSNAFPDAKRANEDLVKFARMNENRIYKLLRSLMNPQFDLKTLIKNYAECNRRIEQSSSAILPTFQIFMKRSANLIMNETTVSALYKRLGEAVQSTEGEDSGEATTIADLLRATAIGYPAVTRNTLPQLIRTLYDDEMIMQDSIIVDTSIIMLDRLGRWQSDVITYDDQICNKLRDITMHGLRAQPKHAASCLATNPVKEPARKLFDSLVTDLASSEGQRLIGHLSALNRLVKSGTSTEESLEALRNFAVELVNEPNDNTSMEVDDRTYYSADDMPDSINAKIQCLKILTNIQKKSDAEAFDADFSTLLTKLLSNYDEAATDVAANACLRLQAGICVLKLWQCSGLSSQIIQNFFRPLVWLVQDPAYEVRNLLLARLSHYLSARRVTDPHADIMLFFAALDPETENVAIDSNATHALQAKQSISTRIQRCTPEMRLVHFELIFVRLLHLIVHHPDFTRDENEVTNALSYINLYLSLVASKDNISLLFHLAIKLKTVRDAESQWYSENLYLISEIAQHTIKAYAASKTWSIVTYPGSVKMPMDIFKALPSKEVQAEIAKKTFLPFDLLQVVTASTQRAKTITQATNEAKKSKQQKARKSPEEGEDSGEQPKAKRVRAKTTLNGEKSKKTTTASNKKKRKAKPDWAGSSEDAEPDPSDNDEGGAGMDKVLKEEKPTRKSKRQPVPRKKATKQTDDEENDDD